IGIHGVKSEFARKVKARDSGMTVDELVRMRTPRARLEIPRPPARDYILFSGLLLAQTSCFNFPVGGPPMKLFARDGDSLIRAVGMLIGGLGLGAAHVRARSGAREEAARPR